MSKYKITKKYGNMQALIWLGMAIVLTVVVVAMLGSENVSFKPSVVQQSVHNLFKLLDRSAGAAWTEIKDSQEAQTATKRLQHIADTLAYNKQCRITKIHSGDRFTCLDIQNNQTAVLKMHQLQAPAPTTPLGNMAKVWMERQILGKMAGVKIKQSNQKQQEIELFVDNLNINQFAISEGILMLSPYFDGDISYVELQKQARRDKKGLWNVQP